MPRTPARVTQADIARALRAVSYVRGVLAEGVKRRLGADEMLAGSLLLQCVEDWLNPLLEASEEDT